MESARARSQHATQAHIEAQPIRISLLFLNMMNTRDRRTCHAQYDRRIGTPCGGALMIHA